MPIIPKPFTQAEKIIRSVFSGRPSIFATEDLNRQFDVIEDGARRLSQTVGAIRENWHIQNVINDNTVGGIRTISFSSMALVPTDNTKPAYIYVNGIRFDALAKIFTNTSIVLNSNLNQFPNLYFFLIAEKKTIDFATDPVMSGVNSTEFPNQLPSSDTVVYANERFAYSLNADGSTIGLGPNEEIICLIATMREKVTHTSTGAPNYTISQNRSWYVHYNCATLDDILTELPEEDIDNATTGKYPGNPSVIDALLALKGRFLSKESFFSVVAEKVVQQIAPVIDAGTLAYQDISNVFSAFNNFSKAFAVSTGSASFSNSTLNIRVSGGAPYFEITLNPTATKASVADLVQINGVTESAYPAGSVVVGRIKVSTGKTWELSALGTGGFFQTNLSHNTGLLDQGGGGFFAGSGWNNTNTYMTFVFVKTSTGWSVISSDLIGYMFSNAASLIASNTFQSTNIFQGLSTFNGQANFNSQVGINAGIRPGATSFLPTLITLGPFSYTVIPFTWDMDNNTTKSFAHGGLDITKVVGMHGAIRSDTGANMYPMDGAPSTGWWVASIDATNVNLQRGTGFDSTAFQSSSITRGHLVLFHKV